MWIKYRFRFASHHSEWEWAYAAVTTQAEAEEYVDEQGRRLGYDYSDKYRGFDAELVATAPRWVVESAIRRAGARLIAAEYEAAKYVALLESASPCLQCDAAAPVAATADGPRTHCPSCGRVVDPATLTFLLMPTDTAAVTLLKHLVESGPLQGPHDWPISKDSLDRAAFQQLVDLGLASGSAENDTYTVKASTRGHREWQAHKEHAK